jgi:predicted DNA-binding transcriptional regulator AlpA
MCGISSGLWEQMHAAGQVPAPLRFGRAVRWRIRELRAWIEAGAPTRARWRYDPIAPAQERP